MLDEFVVVSGARYVMVLGNKDYSYMGRGLRYCVTLILESLEAFGVAIIVDIISLLHPLESGLIPTVITPFGDKIVENRGDKPQPWYYIPPPSLCLDTTKQ